MNMGSFVHEVLENAVSEKIKTKEQLYNIRDQVASEPQWKGINLKASTEALDVFWERNRNTIANNLMVEQRFNVPLGGFNFKGFIDRVDKIPGTQNEVEIIDYKTGKYEPGPDERSKQLLLYARGLENIHPQYKVKKLTLELLALPASRTFELKDGKYESSGNARVGSLDGSAIDNMIEIAKQIAYDYEHGFSKTRNESACRDCGYKLYCGE
jgi:DNA helicase-2/ATP-dependent DNA helicase PcrA